MSNASLTVNGTEYLGWTDISVTRSLEQLAHSFEVTFSEHWTGQSSPIPILEGDACTLQLDDMLVVTGYVDDAEIEYDAETHSMYVAGHSKTGDLVDCAAIYETGKGQWRNQDLQRIAEDLCAPFGVTVAVLTDIGEPFRRFALQDGETVHEALERAARMRGVLLTTQTDGNLAIERTGNARTDTVIEYGANVIKGGRRGTWKDRYSVYTVKAQVSGDDDFMGRSAASPKRQSTDADVTRYRPLIVLAEGQEAGSELQKRADWERNVRAGRAQRVSYTLDGWTNAEGLWTPNTLTRVIDPKLKVDAELLVVSVRQRMGAGGTFTDVELCAPEAFSVEPLVPKPDRGSAYL